MEPTNTERLLMPYASHVADGTARTPVGIILFAAAHLLLGAAILVATAMLVRSIPRVAWSKPENLIWPALAVVLALSMLVGGIVLLLKGRLAWLTCVVSFACLATAEAFATVLGVVMFIHSGGLNATWGAAQASVATPLMAMSCVLLGYLAGEKARRTFGLEPGETPMVVRWISRAILIGFIGALLLAVMV